MMAGLFPCTISRSRAGSVQRGRLRPGMIVLTMALSLLWSAGALFAVEELVLGNGGDIDWQGVELTAVGVTAITPEHRTLLDRNITELGVAPSDLIEFANSEFPGAILPQRVSEGTNVASQIFERGGEITAPSVADLEGAEKTKILESLVVAERTGLALERKDDNALGTLVNIDLGARIGVRSIRFFPRNTVFPDPTTPYQSDFLRRFRIRVNDGLNLTDGGNPIWEEYLVENGNEAAVTTITLDPPRLLRFVRLEAISGIPFELEKVQVFGEGFLPTARYVSPVIDMQAGANWGVMRWKQIAIGDSEKARVEIRTRTGSDSTPFTYTRKQVGRRGAEEIATSVDDPLEPLLRDEYLKLPVRGIAGQHEFERGSVRDDAANWSPWTAPYDPAEGTSAAGVEIASPGLTQFVQISMDFSSEDLGSGVAVDNLSFTFTSPPLAKEIVGEVFPREVRGATDVDFVYAVRAEMEPGLQGFDAIEVRSDQPMQRIKSIEIVDSEGVSLLNQDFTVQNAATEEGDVAIQEFAAERFVVSFPRVFESGTLIKVQFQGRVLSFSNIFKGRVLLLAEEAFQDVPSGNAADLGVGDEPGRSGVTVLSPELTKGQLVRNLSLDAVVTPNGDGINDRAAVAFEVVTIVGQAELDVAVFDLAGRQVRSLMAQSVANGIYDAERVEGLAWDGRDRVGDLVPPGVYIVRVRLRADVRDTGAARTIGVAY